MFEYLYKLLVKKTVLAGFAVLGTALVLGVAFWWVFL